ncbi:hypothetical protein [Bacterioplanes sanyensis]|nr:hypothetical protein [Bacterioplanes sanyensis]
MKKSSLVLLFFTPAVTAMQSLDDEALGQVTGEGIGATFEDVVLYSGDYGRPDDFQLRLRLTDESPLQADYLVFSELRFNKSGEQPGSVNGAGYFGSYTDPFVVADIRTLTEQHVVSSGPLAGQNRQQTALYTAFPAADLQQTERSFYHFSDTQLGVENEIVRYNTINLSRGDQEKYYNGLPVGFFDGNESNVNLGNLYAMDDSYASLQLAQQDRLDNAASKFDLHMRIDSLTTEADRNDANESFLSYVDVFGARLYGTEFYLWGHDNQGETLNSNPYSNNGGPVYADRGLALSLSLGLQADAIRLTTDADQSLASTLALNNVDVYIPFGSVDQPVTISTVKYDQFVRGQWAAGVREGVEKTQLRLEIAGLPQDVGQAPQGNIFIESMSFGDPNDEEVITGRQDIFLRDANGNIIETVPDVIHRAFVPKTVTYNEQVDLYNAANPNNQIPNIPNQNVVEIRGLEIQRLVITTQDL